MQTGSLALASTVPSEDAVFAELERQLGRANFDHWFREKTTLTVSDDELTVGVGSPFLQKWMQRQFRTEVTAAAQSVLGSRARVSFRVDPKVLTNRGTEATQPAQTLPSLQRRTRPSERTKTAPASPRKGRRFANLDDFVLGSSNELAVTAARQVCQAPGTYNPLFLHGGVGTGKTHLLEGVYRRLRQNFPSLGVLFLTSEAFANAFTSALRERTLPSFRQRFRNVDVLLVDDIDFLNGKRVIQEEFLHTFKQLASHDRQVIVTSDRHPRLFLKLSDELSTRFLSGLVCRLEPPGLETRQKIVQRKAEHLGAKIAPEALDFVASRFSNNVRELEGALNSLSTYHHMTGQRVGGATARRVLSQLERDCIKVVRLPDVDRVVCDFFGVNSDDLKSPRRHRSTSEPRMLSMFLMRKHTRAAYTEIGAYYGGRNHSTVMAAEKKVGKWLDDGVSLKVATESWPLDEILSALEQQLQSG